MEELGYWLELLHTPTIGARRYQQLLSHISHPRELFDGSRSELLDKLPARAKQYLNNPDWRLTEPGAREMDWRYPARLRLRTSHYLNQTPGGSRYRGG